jgi:iron complex transport system substrate-binding protein
MYPPQRIVCLTEETVETLYLLGEEARIVGVSGYAVRPARVRREKPRVSAFVSADIDKSSRSRPTSCSPSPTCRPTSRPR